MKIRTKYHGETEIDEKEIWQFKKGIPGFPDEKEFVILALPENHVYGILQSVQTPSIGFVVINPFHFFPHYSFDLDETSMEQLGLEDEKDVLVTSANLTFHGLEGNIEIGVRLRGEPAGEARKVFSHLVENGIVEEVD